MALKKIFAEVGAAAGSAAASQHVAVVSARRGEEEGAKFGLEQGRKAGEAAARKLKDEENKLLKEEGEHFYFRNPIEFHVKLLNLSDYLS